MAAANERIDSRLQRYNDVVFSCLEQDGSVVQSQTHLQDSQLGPRLSSKNDITKQKQQNRKNNEMILVNREDFKVVMQQLADAERYAKYLISSGNIWRVEIERLKKTNENINFSSSFRATGAPYINSANICVLK